MVFNIPGFGRLTRHVRGAAQDTIDECGDPVRQRQTGIERDPPIDPSPALRIPIGYTDDNNHTPCYIDLTEPGTHGLLVQSDSALPEVTQ
ncbi:hypothetical protein BH09ACT7_BH09ACT7_54250 [soil metagenome]